MNSISATIAGDLVYQSVTPGLFLYEKTCIVMLCMLRSTVGVCAHIDVHCQNMFLNEHSILLFSCRRRLLECSVLPCGLSLSLFSSPALIGIGDKLFLSPFITEAKWEGKRYERLF